jgi:uncharacterized repeat protein (TIGR03803 family)
MKLGARHILGLLLAVIALQQPLTRSTFAQSNYTIVGDLSSIGGATPLSGLVRGSDGALYGTTSGGGSSNCGMVYRLAADGALTEIHSFTASQGCGPVGDLAQGTDGALYGATYLGGDAGLGVVFKVALDGTFTRLHSFAGGANGSYGGYPYAGLTLAPNGLFYGTTQMGTIFTISPQGTLVTITQGLYNPQAALTQGSDGFLYGTTGGSGAGVGSIFRIDLAGNLTVLHDFPIRPGENPDKPEGGQLLGELVEAADGNFYGTTSLGGPNAGDAGTIFRMTPAGVVTTVHAFPEVGFQSYPQGGSPWAGLTRGTDGNLYGIATIGGDGLNGMIFRLSLDGTFTVLRSFDGVDGSASQEDSPLEVSPGVLQGTTSAGIIYRLAVGTNAAPVAQELSVTSDEDVAVSGTLTATDADAEAPTYAIVSNGTIGSAVLTDASTGAFTYTPNLNVHGTDTFTFRANDGMADSNVATVTVTIAPVNDPPVAVGGNVTLAEDAPLSATLSATDVDGPSLTLSIVANGTLGTAVVTNAVTGAFSYTPNGNAHGTDRFTFAASDGTLTSAVATMTVTITPANDAPFAHAQALRTVEDTPLGLTVTAADPEETALQFSLVNGPAHGTLDGSLPSVTYTPASNYQGSDSFTFRANDGQVDGAVATVSVSVVPALWTRSGPRGGAVAGLVADPRDSGMVYAAVSNVGVVRTIDHGASWSPLNTGLIGGTIVDALLVDGTIPTTLWALAGAGRLYKSADGGGSWTQRHFLPNARTLVSHPTAPNRLYAAGHGSVFRSTDGAATWTSSSSGLPTTGLSANLTSIVVDPTDAAVAYVGSLGGGVFKSADGGLTWASGGLPGASVGTLAVDPAVPQVVYAATSGGIYKTINGGASWTVQNAGLTAFDIAGLAIDPSNPLVLYAATSTGAGGAIHRSIDAAASWTPVTTLPGKVDFRSLLVHPRSSSVIYAGTDGAGVLRSLDGGTTWAFVETGLGPSTRALAVAASAPSIVYAGTFAGVARSTDAAASWGLPDAGLAGAQAVAVHPSDADTAYAESSGQLFKTENGGAAWINRSAGLSGGVASIAIDPATPQTVYVGTRAGIFKSIDGALTWALQNASFGASPELRRILIDPTTPSTLYVSTRTGVFKSMDGAASWVLTSGGLTDLNVLAFAMDPQVPSTLYAAVNVFGGGIFRSTDGAATWTRINQTSFSNSVLGLAVDPTAPSRLYAAVSAAGVYRSVNGGVTWAAIAPGLLTNVGASAVVVSTAGIAFAGTENGVYRLDLASNDAPTANDLQVAVTEDSAQALTLTGMDPDSQPLTFAVVTSPLHGTLSGAPPNLTYTPASNYSGPDAFRFTASDGTATSDLATVSIVVGGVNDSPLAAAGSFTTDEDTSANGALAATDPDGPTLTFSIVTNGTRGVAVITDPTAGAVTYTPNPNVNGTDTFTFQVSDGTLTSNIAAVTVTIVPVPDVPIARDGVVTTTAGVSVDGAFVVTAGDGGAVLFDVATPPARGAVTVTDASAGAFTYTPGSGQTGYDSFSFTAAGGDGSSTTATQMVLIVAGDPRWAGQTIRSSVGSGAVQGNGASAEAVASADGRHIAFSSSASTLVGGDTNGTEDVFVHDRQTGVTTRVSVTTGGAQAAQGGTVPAISLDGRYVAFESADLNLAAGGAFGVTRVFLHDRQTGQTTVVSIASTGGTVSGDSRRPALSADARYVAFDSGASNLVTGDSNGVRDLFVHDRVAGTTARIAGAAGQTNGNSFSPSLSADGRFVAFYSHASNLVAGDTNARPDVFVHDRISGETTLVSRSDAGVLGNQSSGAPRLTPEGRFVAFESFASTLVAGDANNASDIFVHDRSTGVTTRVSVASTGAEANGFSFNPSPSADGRFVAFRSTASNLAAGDTNNALDVFVHDRQTGETRRLSHASDGAEANAASEPPHLSADGRFVSFAASASNLVPDDTNGVDDVFTVGGVAVTPETQAFAATGGAGTIDIAFAYPGTAWAAISNDPWIAVTSQSSASGSGTVGFTVAPNTGPARIGTLTVAAHTVTVTQDEGAEPLAVTVTTPNGGEKVFVNVATSVAWFAAGASSFDVELSRNGGGTFLPIAGCTGLAGSATSCTWTPAGPATTTALVRVRARGAGGTTLADVSDAAFAIATGTPAITVTAPNTALSWVIGSTQSLRWNHNLGLQSLVRVELSRNDGATWETLAASFQNTGATSSTLPWVVTGPASTTARLRVTWLDGPATDVSNVAFSIVRPTITVTAPNTAVTWSVGSTRAITWRHNMAVGQLVNLEISRDGGGTWATIANGVGNATATTGTFTWTVAGPTTSAARVRVSWAPDPGASDASDVDFSVVAPTIAVTAPNTAVTWRVASTQTLRATHNLGAGQPVAFEVSRDNGASWDPIATLTTGTSGTLSYAWVVTGPATSQARIRASWTSDSSVTDLSDVAFRIIPRITVTAPNTAVTWAAGSTRTVTWTHNLGTTEPVNIDLSPDGGGTWLPVAAGIANATATTGTFTGPLPDVTATQALVRVSQASDPANFDVGDVTFLLVAPAVTVTAPNTNVIWTIGSARSIGWTHNLGAAEAMQIELSRDGGATWATLAGSVVNSGSTSATFSWVVTGSPTPTARIRVTWTRNGTVQDVSNVTFRIQ